MKLKRRKLQARCHRAPLGLATAAAGTGAAAALGAPNRSSKPFRLDRRWWSGAAADAAAEDCDTADLVGLDGADVKSVNPKSSETALAAAALAAGLGVG